MSADGADGGWNQAPSARRGRGRGRGGPQRGGDGGGNQGGQGQYQGHTAASGSGNQGSQGQNRRGSGHGTGADTPSSGRQEIGRGVGHPGTGQHQQHHAGGYQSRGQQRGGGRDTYQGSGLQHHAGGGGYTPQGQRSGGGYQQPRGGGWGQQQPRVVSATIDYLKLNVTSDILKENKVDEWHEVKYDGAKKPLPEPSKQPGGVKSRTISLITNNLPLLNLKLPEYIYHYDVEIDLSEENKAEKKKRKTDRTEPKPSTSRSRPSPPSNSDQDPPKPKLAKKIMKVLYRLVQEDNREKSTSSDFVKNIYTVCEPMLRTEYRISLAEIEGEGGNAVYVCKISQAGQRVTTRPIQLCMNNMKDHFLTRKALVQQDFTAVEQALNIALKTTLNMTSIPVGRFSFFNAPGPRDYEHDLGSGLVNWKGFSVLLTMGWKVFVNIDVANTAFIKGQHVYDALLSLYGPGGPTPKDVHTYTDADLQRAAKFLKGVMVEYIIPTGKFNRRIADVLPNDATENRFDIDVGGRMTRTNVMQYFQDQHHVTLRFPKGICLKFGQRAVVPAELCTIVKGQSFNAKLNESQTSNMIRETAKKPEDRLYQIQQHVKNINFGANPVLKDFGLHVTNELHQTNARILPPPTLVYGSDNGQMCLTPLADGGWNMSQNLKFIKPATKFAWGVLNVNRGAYDQDVQRFVGMMCEYAQQVGLDLGTRQEVLCHCYPVQTFGQGSKVDSPKSVLDKCVAEKLKMVIVILPGKGGTLYNQFKMASEISMKGDNMILTQVVQGSTISRKLNEATVKNILYKVNMKMGGTNYLMDSNLQRDVGLWKKIDLLRAPVLIMGADVTHPGVDSKYPSLAGITGSIDRTGMPYQTFLKAQKQADKGAAEVITGLSDIVVDFVTTFIGKTGHKPRKIIYYRDGVGDGQFGEVLNTEMMAIRLGCETVGARPDFCKSCREDWKLGEKTLPNGYKPKITFVAVQKRHKVRFFPKNPADGIGKMLNAPPGCVVDTEIVKTTNTDFYLLSHKGIQGTSRPTRYQVLWDDSDFTNDEIQLLTYYLCHMYCRCTQAVSYPAPTYYAHLAATRAKIYTEMLSDADLKNIATVNTKINRSSAFQQAFRMHFV